MDSRFATENSGFFSTALVCKHINSASVGYTSLNPNLPRFTKTNSPHRQQNIQEGWEMIDLQSCMDDFSIASYIAPALD
ncbi:hypothetical protein N7463_007266 [Penicillium fimorum]|uniref:Uncharacterized protein n=1 Tax=Penicillium fimorum TaxID=1882269 RepID=A0A9W9XVZ1_9EURO|nr:hypothetical protein N7463_007266 [Penicillium fimorum]